MGLLVGGFTTPASAENSFSKVVTIYLEGASNRRAFGHSIITFDKNLNYYTSDDMFSITLKLSSKAEGGKVYLSAVFLEGLGIGSESGGDASGADLYIFTTRMARDFPARRWG